MSAFPPPDATRDSENLVAKPRGRRAALIAIVAGLILTIGGGAAAIAVIASQRGSGAEAEAPATSEEAPAPTTTPEPTPLPSPTASPTPTPEVTPEAPAVHDGLNPDDPSSLTVVVNKQRPLSPAQWAPADLAYPDVPNANGQPLRFEAAVALESMYAEASAAGVPFALVSGFRSYDLQTTLFTNYAAGYGVESAETFSARPGHSEHQTGLAADISECIGCPLSEAFESTPQGQWARANAFRFGYILRYDRGLQPIVGYMYEPWHFRYVGVDVATDMHNRAITTLEEYFGLPAAPSY